MTYPPQGGRGSLPASPKPFRRLPCRKSRLQTSIEGHPIMSTPRLSRHDPVRLAGQGRECTSINKVFGLLQDAVGFPAPGKSPPEESLRGSRSFLACTAASYLVDTYALGTHPPAGRSGRRASCRARKLSRERIPGRYVRTTLLPEMKRASMCSRPPPAKRSLRLAARGTGHVANACSQSREPARTSTARRTGTVGFRKAVGSILVSRLCLTQVI